MLLTLINPKNNKIPFLLGLARTSAKFRSSSIFLFFRTKVKFLKVLIFVCYLRYLLGLGSY